MNIVSRFARQISTAFIVGITVSILSAFAPIRAEASAVVFVGTVGYSYVGYTSILTADRVQNNSPVGSTSGTLRLELWAFKSPYPSTNQTGYKMSQYTLGTLNGGFNFPNVNSGSIAFIPPPDGTWIFTLILTEYTASGVDDGYTARDWDNFPTPVVIGPPPAPVTSYLENPQPNSYQSGVGLISGWSCQGPQIGVSIDGGAIQSVSYGTPRSDVTGVCGVLNTGFGLLVNYNSYGPGVHRAQLYVNGVAKGSPAFFTVTVPSGEFLTGVSSEVVVPNFPFPGRTATLIWQQATQNFAIKSVSP